jgi:hypothetical protein
MVDNEQQIGGPRGNSFVYAPSFCVHDMYAGQGGISAFTVHRASFRVLQLHIVFYPFCSRHCRNEHLPA